MTTKESSTKGQSIPVPREPPEMIARRGKLLGELENQQKSASNASIKACMVKMIQVFKAMEPGSPLDEQLYQEFKEVFIRLSKDPSAIPVPPLFMECVEYMQQRIAVLMPQFQTVATQHNVTVGQPAPAPAAAAAPAPAAAPATPGAPKRAADGFESGASSRKPMDLGGDAAPVPPGAEKQDKQEELESFKNWMKNPGLGKMKG